MPDRYDAIIPLSCGLKKDGTLGEDCRLRTQRAVERVLAGESKILITTGCHDLSQANNDEVVPWTHAEAMARYAEERGISDSDILRERFSLETVAQACFSKWLFAEPEKLRELSFVTADYHAYRAGKICEFIFGPEYRIKTEGINTGAEIGADYKAVEDGKLIPFYQTFAGVRPGDDKGLFNALFNVHGLYKPGSKVRQNPRWDKHIAGIRARILRMHPDWE